MTSALPRRKRQSAPLRRVVWEGFRYQIKFSDVCAYRRRSIFELEKCGEVPARFGGFRRTAWWYVVSCADANDHIPLPFAGRGEPRDGFPAWTVGSNRVGRQSRRAETFFLTKICLALIRRTCKRQCFACLASLHGSIIT